MSEQAIGTDKGFALRRPPRVCGRGCGAPALEGGNLCASHVAREPIVAREVARRRGSATSRGYGYQWRKLRAWILGRDPLCRICGREAATEVDHIRPKPEGSDDPENLQGLCKPCHSRKTATEDTRRDARGAWAGRR